MELNSKGFKNNMADVRVIGYHTCKTEGGWSFVGSEAPFLSCAGDNQWLTQGYYFWTDSDFFAHIWGKVSYKDDYAIVKCTIIMDDELFLDLVGSTRACIYFQKLLTKFRERLKKISPEKEPTVNAVIAYWRKQSEKNESVFPFVAIKVQDESERGTLEFTGKGRRESMRVSIPRQQVCLFEKGLRFLKEKELVHPEEFVNRSKL